MAYTVYLGRDNWVSLILEENSTAVDLSGTTGIGLRLGRTWIYSTNGSTSPIRWAQASFAPGEVRMALGHTPSLEPMTVRAPLIVYDSNNTAGIVFGHMHIDIIADPGAT